MIVTKEPTYRRNQPSLEKAVRVQTAYGVSCQCQTCSELWRTEREWDELLKKNRITMNKFQSSRLAINRVHVTLLQQNI